MMASEHDADTISGQVVSHTYRIEVKVPRVARPTDVLWRTLVPPVAYNQAIDAGEHLHESLLLAGIDPAEVDTFFMENVRCIEYTVETRRTRELPYTRENIAPKA
jgi:hypothetical protein